MGWYGTKPIENDETTLKLRRNKIFNNPELIPFMTEVDPLVKQTSTSTKFLESLYVKLEFTLSNSNAFLLSLSCILNDENNLLFK